MTDQSSSPRLSRRSVVTMGSTLLAGFGSRPPLRGASQVFFVGQLGKYLPGSVW